MKDLTKLADRLDTIGASATALSPDSRMEIINAARILRSAAAGDVAGLMAMVDTYAMLDDKDPLATRAALESALRLALAAREGFVMVPVEPTPDMLEAGAGTKYEKRARNVWRDMIAAAAPKGTT